MDTRARPQANTPPQLSAYQPMPGSLGLGDLVKLLTVVPLDANPTLYKVVSVKMDLGEILHGAGEVFEISYAVV